MHIHWLLDDELYMLIFDSYGYIEQLLKHLLNAKICASVYIKRNKDNFANITDYIPKTILNSNEFIV